MNAKVLVFVVLSVLLFAKPGVSQDKRPPYQYPAEPEVLQKVREWQDLKFGLFMHWGPYSQWGVLESWTLSPEDYPWIIRPKDKSYFQYVKEYENLATTFNPVKFDPAKWANAAKEAGMKYVVFTTKHHDGFNMYDTRASDYKITAKACPFSSNPRTDITKEIFNSFRKENFRIGAYYSITDWHHNDFWWDYFPPFDRNINYSVAKHPEKWERYNDFIACQLEELVSGYGKLDLLWFDLIGISKERLVDWPRFAKLAREHQPGIMMVARGANNQYENYRTPEQEVPEEALDYPWETCMTMGDQWSYKPGDNYKSAHQLVQFLVRIVSRGGNFLLNIGPGPDGDFDPIAYDRLKEIGNWMKINSEAIYGTKPVKPYQENKIAFTQKGNSVYAIYLPDSEEKTLPAQVLISSLQPEKNSKVYLLGHEKPLSWEKFGNGIVITIPPAQQRKPVCQHAWTFKIQLD
jgi:alpha-L-fucosidase